VRSGSRIAIIVVLIVSLVGAGLTRELAWRLRYQQVAGPTHSTRSLSSMNSFALALLLGGLRGPLVMLLWTSSEEQKSEKNLEDFDTKVEWIRLLQPEFDTVHMFQIWNKAYNVSVQMANLANKYTTILDAIEYARGVDAERPQNINILHAIGGLYADKLGGSNEKVYYRQRIRQETQPHSNRQKLERGDPGWRPLEHDPVLDARGNILPQYLKHVYSKPAGVPDGGDWNTGGELQYLEKYQPFTMSEQDYVGGVSPMALGYNYFKRAQVLQGPPYNQRHAQLSDMVIDSRPALALRDWAEEERQRGRASESRVFDKPFSTEPDKMVTNEMPTANVSLVPPTDPAAVRQLQHAIDSYQLSARLDDDAIKEYQRHIKLYTANLTTYEQHMDHVNAMHSLSLGDADFLRAVITKGDERRKALESASAYYNEAAARAQLLILQFYVSDDMVPATYPPGVDKFSIVKQPPEVRAQTLARVLQLLHLQSFDGFAEDRNEYLTYLQRTLVRQQIIEKALAKK